MYLYFALDGQGTATVQAISFNRSEIEEPQLNHADFKVMSKLIFLNVEDHYRFPPYLNASLDLPSSLSYLFWRKYPFKSLPSNFSPENVVELHMPSSQVEQLLIEDKVYMFIYLKFMYDMYCSRLIIISVSLQFLPESSEIKSVESAIFQSSN